MTDTTRPPGYDEAYAAASDDARLFGAGWLMITPAGCQRVPPEAVMIDRSKISHAAPHEFTNEPYGGEFCSICGRSCIGHD